ncbi:LuxR C-terminal-related transcriptional regulator [Microbacterium phyllosphaerae]|uniref:LuxR C-terminal-related transcriptional regulator n=1 Tax=Microbacterium phyllosphaerae TaxID=124798 RepID=UPI00216920B7|nr:LuxR C-terminal-related transcriptional regulator [Microbacterium phyllosphaerae]MCS3442140.1 LuxR family maltose regulon positive regulatory protein [Microbacterium phyllosphaerae]
MQQGPDGRARGARLPLHMLERPRLTEIFDRGHALTVVSGPAGGGKSVLLNQWAAVQDDRGIASVRLGFDESITNEHLMLGEILTQVVVQDLIADRDAARSALRGFDSVRDPSRELGRLLGDLRRTCVILIDNAERVDERSLLSRSVDLLEAAPLLRIVVATRRSTVIRTLQMLVSVDVCVIGPAHLFFTRDEACDVVERVSAQRLPPWALGDESALPLAARALGLTLATQRAPVEIAAVEVQGLADALMAGLIGVDAPPDFEEFLLRTSVPGGVTREIAQRLGWPDGGEEHLDRAELYGLGVWEPVDDGLAFVYTPMLREALVRRLDQRPTEAVAQVRRTVALWASEHGRHLEALTNAMKAKDYVLASRLGRKSWFILSRSNPQDVETLLRRENPLVLARHPLLGMLLALVLLRLGQRLRAFAYFQAAALSLRSRGADDDPVERFWMLSAKTLAERFAGQFRRSAMTADLVVQAFVAMDAEQHAECTGFAALLLSNCGLSYLQVGRISDAIEILELGMTIQVADTVMILEDGVVLRMPDDDGGWYHCAATLAGIYALRGRLSDARRVLDEIDDSDPPSAWRSEQFGVLEQIARAIIAVAALDLDEARLHTDSIAHHLGTTELWPYLVCVQSEIELRGGHPAEAARSLTHAVGRGVNSAVSDYGASMLTLAQAMTSLALGDEAAAHRSVTALPADDPSRRTIEAFTALLAHDDARSFASAEDAQSERDPDLDRFCLAAVTSAVAAARLGKNEASARAFSRAVAVMREESSCAPLALFGADVLREVRELCAPTEQDFLDSYLSRASDVCPFPALPPPVRLTSRELAVMRELRRTSSTEALAAALFVSPNTVKVQRRSAYRKLGASNREQALLRAAELGLLDE